MDLSWINAVIFAVLLSSFGIYVLISVLSNWTNELSSIGVYARASSDREPFAPSSSEEECPLTCVRPP